MEPTTTNRNGSARLPPPPDGWHKWPTASAVARKLGCTRQHVYRLEERGDLLAVDGIATNGRRVRRFDPESVAGLEPSEDEIAGELEDELADDVSGGTEKLLLRVVTEARQLATEARKGTHEAYQLVASPSRELQKLLVEALTQREARIRDLEAQLSAMHDEQRSARREDREFSILEKQVQQDGLRKDQFLRMLAEQGPTVLSQLAQSFGQGAGPLAAWMKTRTPEQQAKLITAIEAVMSIEDELGAKAPPTEGTPK